MNFDTYQTERKVIEHAEVVLARSDAADWPVEYKALLTSFTKLLKITNRLVRMSDRFEERLKSAT